MHIPKCLTENCTQLVFIYKTFVGYNLIFHYLNYFASKVYSALLAYFLSFKLNIFQQLKILNSRRIFLNEYAMVNSVMYGRTNDMNWDEDMQNLKPKKLNDSIMWQENIDLKAVTEDYFSRVYYY